MLVALRDDDGDRAGTLLIRVLLPKGRLRANDWVMQRPYHDTIEKAVELGFLVVFQHVFDPTRVRMIADQNPAARPIDLRPAGTN